MRKKPRREIPPPMSETPRPGGCHHRQPPRGAAAHGRFESRPGAVPWSPSGGNRAILPAMMGGTTGSGGTSYDELTDEELLALALAGDETAQRRLFERLTPVIQARVGSILLRTRPYALRDDVEDFVQGVYVKLFEDDWRRLRMWDPDGGRTLRSWVSLIAEGHVYNALRDQGRRPVLEQVDEDDDDWDQNPSAGASPERRYAAREILLLIFDWLSTETSSSNWQIFDLAYGEGKEVAEIAEITGLSSEVVYQRLSRLRKKARQLYEELDKEPETDSDRRGKDDDGRT